ncbi:MAG: hypothetical protein A2V84_09390 [Chloroflexi bacterium RBG_16_70_13]|nr:MAG: hypothetical protein A2V84_09390 [Chloroflexi bacterium RBG_16_70_13]
MTSSVPGVDWAATAADALRELGFTLLNSDRPAAPGGSQLLVALRDRPTLRHFDPERISCWVAASGRGRAVPIDRRTPGGERSILWGHVHVVDRLGVENRFLTFGGPLRIADIDARLRVVQHISAGPIVRWGGHSQGFDALAGEIGAFFGRLIVPVDYVAGGEARLAAEPPEHLYAAFLRDSDARRREATRRVDPDRDVHLRSWISAETGRIRGAHPAWWEAAGILLDDLDLGPEGLATERAQADEVGATPPGRLGA